MIALTAPAAAPARTLAPILFAAFFTPRLLALDLCDPLPPAAECFDAVFPLARVAALRVVLLFRREPAFPLRLVDFLAIVIS